jgi:hypothetical protein
MDLSALNPKKKANTGAFLHLNHFGTGEPLYQYDDSITDPIEREKQKKAVGLYLMGMDSDYYQSKKHKTVNDILLSKNKKDAKTSEGMEIENIETLAQMTLGWENIDHNGSSIFSKEAVIALYTDYLWVREQADKFVANRANFI